MAWRVLVTCRSFEETRQALEILASAGCVVNLLRPYVEIGDAGLGGETLVAALQGIDAVVAGAGSELNAGVLDRAPSLKLIVRRGVGYNNVDLEAARRHAIAVAITAGTNQDAVADHVFALLLAVVRKVVEAHADLMAGKWKARMGSGLRGKTIGIVGLGRIGKGVAERARGFSMQILASDPVRDDAFAQRLGVRYVPLDELLANSDVVSLHAGLNASTKHMIRAETLATMKPSSVLINTARGPLVDERALADALRQGTIAGAGIDVFETEPGTGSPLIRAPNVVLSPHHAGSTREAHEAANCLASQIVVDYMRGALPDRECLVSAP